MDEVSATAPRDEQESACTAAAAKVETAKRSLDLQLRTIRDDDAKDSWATHINAADERFAAAKRSLALKKEQAELFGKAAAEGGAGAGNTPGYKGPTNDQYLDLTDKVHDDIDASLANTLQVVNDTEDLATATAEQLAKQREQITDVHHSVLSIEEALKRSDALLRTFGKRMATDKMIQLFFMLNVVGAVGLIVYMVLQDQGIGSSDDGGQAADDAVPGADDKVSASTTTDDDTPAATRHFLRW